MEHDELIEHLTLELPPEFRFTDDQADVMYAFHEGSGRVAVGSGAGTGKTTTLTRIVAETVTRLAEPTPGDLDANPFDDILVTTFTRDAAGQLKTKIKHILRAHEANGGTEFDPALWRWLETDSTISTIDSFVADLLREIAPEVYVAPGFEVRDEIETEDLLQEVIRELRDDDDYAEALTLLDDVLEDTTPRQYLFDIQQKLREFCYEFPDPSASPGTTIFADEMRNELHHGREPPFDESDIRDIVSHVTGIPQTNIDGGTAETREAIERDYHYNIAFAEALDELIDAFEAAYDRLTRESGQLSYQDIVYIVWEYLEREESQGLRSGLSDRFSKVFIDEFQDTSYAQCRILRHLITNDDDGGDVLVIGDVKQSIYGWRSADPEIFARILEHAERENENPDEYLGVTGWTQTDLVTNFRSHPHLVQAGNHLFDRVFRNGGLGGIGNFPIASQALRPHRPPTNDDDAHLHILPLGDATADDWRTRDPVRTAGTIRTMVDDDSYTIGDRDNERPVKAGDVTLLFRRGTYMRQFRDALDDHGLDNSIVAERGLFKTDEIGFIVDVLDWFANPHSKDSLLRILRSPVTALSDRTLRYLARFDWNLPQALEEWPDGELPASDLERLSGLVDLRSDLRWDREGSKAKLVQKIIQHTGLETILLSGDDAMQKYGNLWVLVELVRDWEDEELLPYREFVDRLVRYRRMARSNDESFEVAQVADASADKTVKLRTVHSAKGLEFGVVILPDLLAGPGGRVQGRDRIYYRDIDNGEHRVAVRPRASGDPINFDDGPGGTWIRSDYRCTLWLAPDRDSNTGEFRYDHPLNPAVESDFAEFWRLLYVAFTRAEDHLILPLGDSITHHHRWSSWAHPLLDVFREGSEWTIPEDGEPADFSLDRSAMHPDDDSPDSIPLDIGLIDRADPIDTEPLGLPTLSSIPDAEEPESQDSRDEPEQQPFTPLELNPSTLHDLMACPRRYQYRALEEISEARGESPPGSNAPAGYSPSYWGTLTHNAMEALHCDKRTGELGEEETALTEFLDQHAEIHDELLAVVDQYRASAIWNAVQDAETVLAEYELSAIHPTEPHVHLSGFVDLLIQTADGWEIIDFKTGTPPAADSYLANQYRLQLATYAWLLDQEYDIEASKLVIYYVQGGKSREVSPDWGEFSAYLRDLPDRLFVESEEGLPTRPDPDPVHADADELDLESRCGSCPFTSICPEWANE